MKYLLAQEANKAMLNSLKLGTPKPPSWLELIKGVY